MAYSCILAAVAPHQVERYKSGQLNSIHPSKTIQCSHLLAYWVQLQPLGNLLGEIIDGGERLRDDFWHPLRVPAAHSPAAVQKLYSMLVEAWASIPGKDASDWYVIEISKVIGLLEHANSLQLCVVIVLQPPLDSERAKLVENPLSHF